MNNTKKIIKSPHLSIYRMEPHMIVSMMHRITGTILSIIIIVGINLYTLSELTTNHNILYFTDLFFNKFYIIIRSAFVFSLSYHMMHGISHMIWDTGKNLDIQTLYKIGKLSIGLPTIITIIDLLTI